MTFARRACVATLFAALAGCGRQHVQPQPAATAAPAQTAAPTPAPWSERERRNAATVLSHAFAAPLLAGAGLVVLAGDGSTLFARNARARMTPASTLKLLIGATALSDLGTAHRLDTSFVALEAPDADGAINGPLWLVGGGDPLLRSDDLRGGVAMLARAGVRRVTGGLIVDATTFSGPEQNAHWNPADLVYDYAAGTSALSLDGDVAEFRVTPAEPGEPARVDMHPANDNVGFSGGITTSSYGDSDVTIVRKALPDSVNRNDFDVSGHIAAGAAQSFYEPVVGIPSFVAGATASMLAERGIQLDGGTSHGPAPFAARTLWLHHSLPLSALLREMLVFSDNHTAEQLLRVVGFERGHAGTEHAGILAEREFLARNRIDAGRLRVLDGSGLSPDDVVTPLLLAQILAVALNGPDKDVFLRALPLVGMEGTVRHHDLKVARGRVRAKSGHIGGVNALAGTVQTRRHGRVEFAFIVNGPYADADAVTQGTDDALDALGNL